MNRRVFFVIPLCLGLLFLVFLLWQTQIFGFVPKKIEAAPNFPNIKIVLPDQEYVTSLSDLGITLEVGKEGKTNEHILYIPQLAFETEVTYDSERGILVASNFPKTYKILYSDLLPLLKLSSLESELVISPKYELRDEPISSLEEYNARLSTIFQSPLTIKLKDGGNFVDYHLTPSLLKKLILPPSSSLEMPLNIRKDFLLSSIIPTLTPKQKEFFDSESLYVNTLTAINQRFNGVSATTVLGVDDGPASSGELANKYLEVDISQQKMYFFINGSLYKSYNISTGLEYPTPIGQFKILNKDPLAYSAIYDVWMPYWMAITYASDVKAYIGLHEIAYAVTARGTPFYKSGYYIGDKNTGGCVAMAPKDSREIYNLSEIGMMVRIIN